MTDQLISEESSAGNKVRPRRFRPIHYLGSKLRLLDAIADVLNELDSGRGPVVDLFSGSGVVAARLAHDRDAVAVDIQEYSRVLASALLSPARLAPQDVAALLSDARDVEAGLLDTELSALVAHESDCVSALQSGDPEPMAQLFEHGSLVTYEEREGPPNGSLIDAQQAALRALCNFESAMTLTRLYGGVYFSYRQAIRLDCLLLTIRSLPAQSVDTGLAAAMSAASEIVTSVGSHFAQPLRPRDPDGRPKLTALLRAASRRDIDVYELFEERLRRFVSLPAHEHRAMALRADYRDFLSSFEGEVAAIYADPPYTRDHYSRFYHVLETMALGDVPGVSRVQVGGESLISRGLYRSSRHQSPFCIKSQAPSAFADLYSAVRRFDVPLVLSYSPYTNGTAARPRPRVLTVPEVADIARSVFSQVDVRPAGRLSHSRFNAAHLNGEVLQEAEVFIVCEP